MRPPKTWRCSTCGATKPPESFARVYSKADENTPLVCLSCIVVPAAGDYIKYGFPTALGTEWSENKSDRSQIRALNRVLANGSIRPWEREDGTPDDEAWAAHVERVEGLKAGAL